MAIVRHRSSYAPLAPDALAAWRGVPAAIASDSLNRAQSMAAEIKPLLPDSRMVGHARTVSTMLADNSAIHALLTLIEPGEILVVAAGGLMDVAALGGIMMTYAKHRGVAGVVVDGTVRDVAELRAMGVPVFCRGAVPRGPHKGHGGDIDGPVSCAGVVVHPGDLVVGDPDGVTVVPRALCEATLATARATMEREAATIKAIAAGEAPAKRLGIVVPEPV